MKKYLFIFALVISSAVQAQITGTPSVTPTTGQNTDASNSSATPSGSQTTGTQATGSANSFSKNQRISFILGIGASWSTRFLYKDPTLNNDYNVMIEAAQPVKTNISIGIVYTPKVYDIVTRRRTGVNTYATEVSHAAKGITFATFINPITLSGATQNKYFNNIDFGAGIGHRTASGWLIMATMEFFVVDQPRKWFLDQYRNNATPYIVNDQRQSMLDLNNGNIMIPTTIMTLGFKLCYTFDVVKNYQNAYAELNQH